MSNEILKNIADSFKEVEPQIKEAEDLIKALKEAGEDTSTMEADLRTLKVRKEKWQRMLAARGLMK